MLVFDDDMDQCISYRHSDKKTKDNAFADFVREHILTLKPIDEEAQQTINRIISGELELEPVTIMVSLDNFKVIMARLLKYFGNDGDYNWIDTSKCKSFMNLFSAPAFRNFNGDITKWNTGSVECMTGMFKGCIRFDRDITGWDVSRVKFINKTAYADANPALERMFQQMKKEGKFNTKLPMVKL